MGIQCRRVWLPKDRGFIRVTNRTAGWLRVMRFAVLTTSYGALEQICPACRNWNLVLLFPSAIMPTGIQTTDKLQASDGMLIQCPLMPNKTIETTA